MSRIDRRRVRGSLVRHLPLEVLGTPGAVGSAWVSAQAATEASTTAASADALVSEYLAEGAFR